MGASKGQEWFKVYVSIRAVMVFVFFYTFVL